MKNCRLSTMGLHRCAIGLAWASVVRERVIDVGDWVCPIEIVEVNTQQGHYSQRGGDKKPTYCQNSYIEAAYSHL